MMGPSNVLNISTVLHRRRQYLKSTNTTPAHHPVVITMSDPAQPQQLLPPLHLRRQRLHLYRNLVYLE